MRVPFQKLLEGDKPPVGVFVQSAAPEFVEAAAYAGFRYAGVDLEHTYYGVEKTAEMIRAGEAEGLSMLVRVPSLDKVLMKKSMDFGAAGIVIPNIDTPEQAAEAVSICRFTPEGTRGACPGVRANFYGKGGSEYYEKENREVAVIPLIESKVGVENFEEILKVPGITAVFLGPIDLSVDMGLKGNIDHPDVQNAIMTMIRQAKAAGVPVGALGLNHEFIENMFNEGLDFLCYGIDTILMYQKCQSVMDEINGILDK